MKRFKVKSWVTWRGEIDDPRYVKEGEIYDAEFELKYRQMYCETKFGIVALSEGEYEIVPEPVETEYEVG